MAGYIPNVKEDREAMLVEIGAGSIESLFAASIPEVLRLKDKKLELPGPLSEQELDSHMKQIAGMNRSIGAGEKGGLVCFLGAGVYDHYIPAIVKHIVSRQEFYTSYTPYQPEISQGMLQAIFEYQTMICSLTGMDVSNASLYDGATALAEAATMACRATGRKRVLVAKAVNPEYRKVLKTYAKFGGWEIAEVPCLECVTNLDDLKAMTQQDGNSTAANTDSASANGDNTATDRDRASANSGGIAAIIIQSPNFFGFLEDIKGAAEIAHANGALLIASADPISLAILEAPGVLGADIAAGEGQALGNALNFGGPHFGYLAAKMPLLRRMPGRIVGETKDREGRRSFVLTIQAREQHIRREKATSNICSNQALNALAASVYLTAAGKRGLAEVANLCLQKSHYAYDKLADTGKFEPLASKHPYFKEFALRAKKGVDVPAINRLLLESGFLGGFDAGAAYPDDPDKKGVWIVAVTEKRTKTEIDKLANIIRENKTGENK